MHRELKTCAAYTCTFLIPRQLQGAGGGGDDASLTPKERLARKKEAERQRRELELKLATMNMAKEQGIAAQRKAANIHGSNVHGLPGATAASAPGGGGGGDMGGLGTMAAMGALSDPSGGAGGRMGMGGDRDRSSYSPGRDADDGFSDTFVNMGTMPAGGGGTMVSVTNGWSDVSSFHEPSALETMILLHTGEWENKTAGISGASASPRQP
jgi:hypothetical protein